MGDRCGLSLPRFGCGRSSLCARVTELHPPAPQRVLIFHPCVVEQFDVNRCFAADLKCGDFLLFLQRPYGCDAPDARYLRKTTVRTLLAFPAELAVADCLGLQWPVAKQLPLNLLPWLALT